MLQELSVVEQRYLAVREVLDGAKGRSMRYADAGGVRIAYDDHGPRADAASLCLPGWCLNRGFFAALAERLGARHRVITLDLARARGL